MPHNFMQGGFMFDVIPIIVGVMFFIMFAFIAFTILKSILQWNKNNHSPRLSSEATVVTKRISVTHHNGSNNHMTDSSYITYYATFEFPSGDRMEFCISDYESGMLAENDRGTLTFQGTRYLSFKRL